MRTSPLFFLCLVLFTLSLESIGDAQAQFPGGGMRGRGGMGGMGGPGGSPRQVAPAQRDPLQDLDDRLAMLQEDLHLRQDQEGAWLAYAERVRAIAADIARDRQRLQEKTPVLVQLDRVVDGTRNRLTALEDITASAKTLFAALTPEQQAAADPRLANIVAALVRPAAEMSVVMPPGDVAPRMR
jgi:LTXXQ motif family protein